MPNDTRTLEIAAKIGNQPRVTSFVELRPPRQPQPQVEVLIDGRRVNLSRKTDPRVIPITGQATLAVGLSDGSNEWGYAKLMCDQAPAPPTTEVPMVGSLIVRVLGQNGEALVPIPNAFVHLKNQAGGAWIKRQTNQNGELYTNRLPAGQWLASARVNVESRGTPNKQLTVQAGRQTTIDIVIQREQPRPEPTRLMVRVVKQEIERRMETTRRGELQADVMKNVPVQRPILNANVYLRRAGMENQGYQLQRSQNGDGLYYIDIDEGAAAGRWEYAVQTPESNQVYKGAVMITKGTPALIQIGGAAEPKNPPPGLNVGGQWRCNCGGLVTLRQNGTRVVGTETNDNGQNRITGTIEGNSFRVRYVASDGTEGNGELVPDGNGSLSGQVWWSDGERSPTTLTPMRVNY